MNKNGNALNTKSSDRPHASRDLGLATRLLVAAAAKWLVLSAIVVWLLCLPILVRRQAHDLSDITERSLYDFSVVATAAILAVPLSVAFLRWLAAATAADQRRNRTQFYLDHLVRGDSAHAFRDWLLAGLITGAAYLFWIVVARLCGIKPPAPDNLLDWMRIRFAALIISSILGTAVAARIVPDRQATLMQGPWQKLGVLCLQAIICGGMFLTCQLVLYPLSAWSAAGSLVSLGWLLTVTTVGTLVGAWWSDRRLLMLQRERRIGGEQVRGCDDDNTHNRRGCPIRKNDLSVRGVS